MSITRRFLLLTASSAAVGLPRISFAQSEDLKSALDAALQAPVERGDVPGIAAAITDPEATIYEGAAGERRLGSGEPITTEGVFYMASMTKPITAVAAMQLVEQGKLDLDSPISTWIPSAAELQVLEGFDEAGAPIMRPPSREVTLRDLMTHSSGFVYTLWDAELARYDEEVEKLPQLDYDNDESWLHPLRFDPGTKWEYGISIDWIGRLVQEVSGQSLGDYFQQHIFDPLGMTMTGYTLTPEMEEMRVSSHQRNEAGELTATDWKSAQDPAREYGGGGLYGTVGDYQKFMRMILNDGSANGQQVLQPESVAQMIQNNMGELRVGMLHTTNPAVSEDAEFFPGLEKTWGLSFMINEEQAPTGRPAGSLAWAGIQNTFFWIDLENRIGGVWMAQLYPFVDTKTLQAFNEFESAYYRARSS